MELIKLEGREVGERKREIERSKSRIWILDNEVGKNFKSKNSLKCEVFESEVFDKAVT